MNDVINVSIAKTAFTTEREAYATLEAYLKELATFYKNEEDSNEILGDIEERIAELLIERGAKERIVCLVDINKIIEILGEPYITEDEDNSNMGEQKQKKSLYRDKNNRVLGGVCSGISAYTSIDVVLVRVIVVLAVLAVCFLLTSHSLSNWGGALLLPSILIYSFFWAIIPAAKSMEQRFAMRGESPSIGNIKDRVRESELGVYALEEQSSSFLSLLGGLIRVFIAVIMLMIGLSGLTGGWFLLIGSAVFGEYTPASMIEYINFDIDLLWLKITAVLCYFIPFIGMLYCGIMLITKFKTPKWKPGLILVLVWVISLIALISLGLIGAKPYYNSDSNYNSVALEGGLDTLYINYINAPDQERAIAHISANSHDLDVVYVVNQERSNMNFIVYPSLRIYRSDKYEGNVNYRHSFFSPLSVFEKGSTQMSYENSISIEGNTINVKPALYSKEVKYNGERGNITINIPDEVVVILNEPVEFEFAGSNRYKTHGVRPWWFN